MARRTQTYAIRLAVEGGGQVKAELVSVGQSGEQSLKRIESAGERASGMVASRWQPGQGEDRADERHRRLQLWLTTLSGLSVLSGIVLHVWL
jgi:hypothetical protein